jgi:stage II sporulation protein R
MLRVRIGFIIILTVMTGLLLAGNHWFRGARDRAVYAFVTGNLLRLHVVANSNDPADQKLKLMVKERILRETRGLTGVRSRREALAFLAEHRGALAKAAEEELRKHGCADPVRLEIGRYPFPEKSYPFGVLPGGVYQALRVVVGEGQGENWWCVLFPPVCHLAAGEGQERPEPPAALRLRWRAWEEFLRAWAEMRKGKEA